MPSCVFRGVLMLFNPHGAVTFALCNMLACAESAPNVDSLVAVQRSTVLEAGQKCFSPFGSLSS